MTKAQSKQNSFWVPINKWNLNELFTTESISPISFYEERNFGNPVNRNQEKVEDLNNIILFSNRIQSDILLEISPDLLDDKYLSKIQKVSKGKLKSFEYSKTIFLKKGSFKVYFNTREILNEFISNSFMLLEVKAVNKYKTDFTINKDNTSKQNNAFYQQRLISKQAGFQPFFDKVFNQIKGLIYGYIIGSIGTLNEKEQDLVSNLSKLKNTIGRVHTDIVLFENYSNFWLINTSKQINDCNKLYFDNFGKNSDVFDTLLLRLQEIDNLNKMRCSDLSKQKSSSYKNDYEIEQRCLEKATQELFKYEDKLKITSLKQELNQIKQEEKDNGKSKGKKREYYKKDTIEYNRKQELKDLIESFKYDYKYKQLKDTIVLQEEKIRNFQFGFTNFDTSITEQFSRISEYLHDITKKSARFFLAKNNKVNEFPDISFDANIVKLANHYNSHQTDFLDFNITFPKSFANKLTNNELNLLTIAVNSVLSQPQGRLSDFSEQRILEIIKNIGQNLPESSEKKTLRDYYLYRVGKRDEFTFPNNPILANILVFLMKHNGHEQINKMLVKKNILHKEISFMLYGCYIGFANMPKTFTNIIFDSNNIKLFNFIDNVLFDNFIKENNENEIMNKNR